MLPRVVGGGWGLAHHQWRGGISHILGGGFDFGPCFVDGWQGGLGVKQGLVARETINSKTTSCLFQRQRS